MSLIGGLVRGVVLALVIGAVSVLAGALAAIFFCGEGTCGFADPVAAILVEPAPGFGGTVNGLMLIGALALLGLAVTFMPDDPAALLVFLFALLLAGVGFLFWLPTAAPADIPAAEASEPILPPRPDPEVLPSCPAGSFRSGGSCVPCFETVVERAPASLRLEPVRSEAHWVYASDSRIARGGESFEVESFVNLLAGSRTICAAPAILVFGSASSDGALARNEARARRRAEHLAEAVRLACGSELDVYALSLGQSAAPRDVPEDRPVSIVKVYPGAEDISGQTILGELGYRMAEGAEVPLLSRSDRFPRPWVGPSGEATRIERMERPEIVTTIRAIGAPPSCRASSGAGLDERPPLRQ